MQRRFTSWSLGVVFGCAWITCFAAQAHSKDAEQQYRFTAPEPLVDIVGGLEKASTPPRVSQIDTVWIGDWSFDSGASCDDTGWERLDLRDLSAITPTGLFWRIDNSFGATGGIVGNAAVLGYVDNACCEDIAGYDNDWYQAIRIEYTGAANLSFDYLLDSELDFDFIQVEEDSACSSFERVNLDFAPNTFASDLRILRYGDSGLNLVGSVAGLPLANYGGGTHCVFISFLSDVGFSPCDGQTLTTIGAGVVIDNISITDGSGTRSEDFVNGSLDIGTFLNVQDESPFGEWGRLFPEITDNDLCTENTTCAWLWTDHTTPTIANVPSLGFAPGGFVVRNWLDNAILSPWISLATTPNANGTVLQLRRFPGNFFSTSEIVANYAVRGRETIQGSQCVSSWGHTLSWNSLDVFTWLTLTWDLSPDFAPTSEDIQLRHRVSDWQWIVGENPPVVFAPGPGPFIDRVRLGRIVISGPVLNEGIDARFQAQDGFATEIHPGITPGTGEHFRPTTDRFGTAAFSEGTELGINGRSPNLITGDSVTVEVQDVRSAGGIVAVDWYGVIVSGPHAGKAPPPYSVGANGFFVVAADSARSAASGAVVADLYFVDLDDDYFRGGDVVHYFWLGTDAGGGVASLPNGLTSVPASVDAAQLATAGMFEVSFLPAIDWDAGYVGRIQADPNGKLEPTGSELANSSQRHCILYVNRINSRRRSGTINRTSFMFTLDRIGYDDAYDVYDHTGMGNTNNHLGGRASLQQVQGYSLIVYDAGNTGPGGTIMPDGSNLDSQKVDQAGWFRNWLGQASVGEAGTATLWVIGSDALEEKPTHPLFTAEMQALLVSPAQPIEPNPDVFGATSFQFQQGAGTCGADFTGDEYSLSGGCPFPRTYDGMASGGSSVETHHYKNPETGAVDMAAIIMNTSAAGRWNTVFQSHPWFDIRDLFPNPPSSPHPAQTMLTKVLGCVLGPACGAAGDPTGVPEDNGIAAPQHTALHANVPNPFNPMTEIRFDLAQDGHVLLQVYDVSGRLVRTLVNGRLTAATDQRVIWDGLDSDGRRAPSGVYLYRLNTQEIQETRKMVLMQ